MPTYEYFCAACQHEFEVFQGIKDKPIRICPRCKARRAQRKISGGSGLLFKGSGFYLTDYRSEGYKKKAEEAKAAEKKPEDKKTDGKDSAGTKETKESSSESSCESSSGAKSAAANKRAPRKGEGSK